MPGWASPWLWTADTWAGLQFGVLAAAAVVAYWQVREARRLREEQTRPFVVVEAEPDDFIIMIGVSNLGPTMARDVRIKIDPPLTSSIKDEEIGKVKMFREPIPSLAPGRRLRTILDSGLSRKADDQPEHPDVYSVRLTYTDDTGRRSFTDDQVIDLGLLWDTSEIRRKTIHNVAEQLEKLVNEQKRWTATTPSGLLVVTPTEQREALAAWKRQRDEVIRQREAEEKDAEVED